MKSFMEICESNLQAHLFISYLSSSGFLPSISCLWTWVIAVLTAVLISFWRIKPVKYLSSPKHKSDLKSLLSDQTTQEDVKEPAVEVTTSERWKKERGSPSVCAVEDDVWTKGKFTAYFEDGDVGDGQVGAVINFSSSFGSAGREELSDWKSYEGTLWRRRMKDLGCHRYLDLTVLNGSVVKLWEGEKLD